MKSPWMPMASFPRDRAVQVLCEDGVLRRAIWYIDKIVLVDAHHTPFKALMWRDL